MVFQNMSWFRKVLVAGVGGAALLGVGTAGVIAADQSISNQSSTEVTGGALGGLLLRRRRGRAGKEDDAFDPVVAACQHDQSGVEHSQPTQHWHPASDGCPARAAISADGRRAPSGRPGLGLDGAAKSRRLTRIDPTNPGLACSGTTPG
jgi:hypothetical protein